MKFIMILLLIVIAVGVFAIAGNTKPDEAPAKPTLTEYCLENC